MAAALQTMRHGQSCLATVSSLKRVTTVWGVGTLVAHFRVQVWWQGDYRITGYTRYDTRFDISAYLLSLPEPIVSRRIGRGT
ncbi:MAG TPA: hypothetical protein DEF43_02905 [Chloroflexus aurantiacus]|nr:MAG: hypothetical protein D6716_04455 [Chloroflexota bacterium]HBW66111.1 hypothetical protein [Chloroflexus aurantiacus]